MKHIHMLFALIIMCMAVAYAKIPKTITSKNGNVFIAIDWNKQTPDLSKDIFKIIKEASSDSTDIFISFYETGLIDIYGNEFIFVSDTTKVVSLCNDEVRRFKNEKYFNNQFTLTDSITGIRRQINQGVDIDEIIFKAKDEAQNINMSKDDIVGKIEGLQQEFHTIYETNPFNPLDRSHLNADTIGIPNYSHSLYHIKRTGKIFDEIIKWQEILKIKYPNPDAPELIDDRDEEF